MLATNISILGSFIGMCEIRLRLLARGSAKRLGKVVGSGRVGALEMARRTTGTGIGGGGVVIGERFAGDGMIHGICGAEEDVLKLGFGEREALQNVHAWDLDLGAVAYAAVFLYI